MGNYDDEVLGHLNPDFPGNQPEPTAIMLMCDGCYEITPENEVIKDGDSFWCSACWAEVLTETSPDNREVLTK